MKTILVDIGSFYTKACVLQHVPVNGGGGESDTQYQFYGRGFFPTLACRAGDLDKGRIYYEHEGQLYAVGYDCASSLRLDQVVTAFNAEAFDAGQALLILKKIVFDYADTQEELDVNVVVDSFERAQVFEQIATTLAHGNVEVAAFRGYDKRRITKNLAISVNVLSSGDAVAGFLDKSGVEFETALVVDVGHNRTKLYVVDDEAGVEMLPSLDCGVSFYYEKILRLLAEESLADNHYLWLVKQIELGCDEVEVRRGGGGDITSTVAALSATVPRHFDISLVMENVRWDLNKEFVRFTTDTLTSYYTNRVEWPEMLVVMGGGASLNGDILRLSLEEGGFCFDGAYVEKQPMYTVLDGAAYALNTNLTGG